MINYELIGKAVTFYTFHLYQKIEMPWIVGEKSIHATLPPGATITKCDLGLLVGSAEQSFIEAMLEQNLKGTYQATTPCFRNEPEDELHQHYFIKTELFSNLDVCESSLEIVIEDALDFFELQNVIRPTVKQLGENCFDIVDGIFGIELGSYGIRKFQDHEWIYGTGCAEPRLSIVLRKQERKEYA